MAQHTLGNLAAEELFVFNEISGMTILISIVQALAGKPDISIKRVNLETVRVSCRALYDRRF
jgi:hypothetical protein